MRTSNQGVCQCTHYVEIEPLPFVVEVGAGSDVLETTTKYVHHINRNSEVDDYIAMSFPSMSKNHNGLQSGFTVGLYGSENILKKLIKLDMMQRMVDRGMLHQYNIEDAYLDDGVVGTAFIRNRQFKKRSAGNLRRMRERAERRGHTWTDHKINLPEVKNVMRLTYEKHPVYVELDTGEIDSSNDIIVSTYGLTDANNRSLLPFYNREFST